MTDVKYEISLLAEEYHQAKKLLDYYAASNTNGLTPEEQTELAIKYHQADAEVLRTFCALQNAKLKYASG